MDEKFTWPCGCILITEPLSFYRWFPCLDHKDIEMSKVVGLLPNNPVREVLETEPLTVEIL